jgi:TRAP-type C4-dicarboxylate transport system permease small subunit
VSPSDTPSDPPPGDAVPAVTTPQTHPLLRALARFENALMIALLAATVMTILVQVFFRYALSRPLSWSNEIATDLLVYIAFVGFAIGVRDNAHVALHLFERRLGRTAQRWLRIGELLVLGVVLAAIGIGGATYAYEQYDVTSPIGVPLWAAFGALPLGGGLGTVHVVVEILALLRGADAPGLAGRTPPDATNVGEAPPPALPGGAV